LVPDCLRGWLALITAIFVGPARTGGEEGLYNVWGDVPGPDDLGPAWDAAERYAVTLLWEALPQARAVPVPAEELTAQAARFRSAARKWPYRQLARAARGRRPRKRSPAGDTDLWLDAAGAMATMQGHIGADLRLLEPVTLLRPADWVGAVIGLVRSGVNTIATAGDLVRYAIAPELKRAVWMTRAGVASPAVIQNRFRPGSLP
jgi:hypothetical protein